MKKLVLLLSVITLSFASIGKISAIRGDAVVISNGNQVKAELNHELNKNDVIKTENNARLQIIFNDNTVTTLGKNTTLAINDYLLDGKNSKIDLEVNKGSFKVITGEISKIARENFSLKANTATIGIRGTVFVGEVGLKVNKLACLQGAIDVKIGNKTSLINSGKQISYEGAKVLKIEAIKTSDFSMTSNQEENKASEEVAKEENKSTDSKSVAEPVKAIENTVTKVSDKQQEKAKEDKINNLVENKPEVPTTPVTPSNPDENIPVIPSEPIVPGVPETPTTPTTPDTPTVPDTKPSTGIKHYSDDKRSAKVDLDNKEVILYKKDSDDEIKKYEVRKNVAVETEIKQNNDQVIIKKTYDRKGNDFTPSNDGKIHLGDKDKFVISEDKLVFDRKQNLSSNDGSKYANTEKDYKDLENSFYNDSNYSSYYNVGGPKYYEDTSSGAGLKIDIKNEYIGAFGNDKHNKELIMSVHKDIIRSQYDGGQIRSEYLNQKKEISSQNQYSIENESDHMEFNFTGNRAGHSSLYMKSYDNEVESKNLVNTTGGSTGRIDSKLKF